MALHCEDIIRRSLNRNMTEPEVLQMEADARRLARQARSAMQAAGQLPDVQQLASQRALQQQLEAAGRKRATHLQQAVLAEGKRTIYEDFKGMEWEGISAMMVGSKYLRPGARDSVDALAGSLKGKYIGGLMHDLEALGPSHWKQFQGHSLDREICAAMFSLDNSQAQAYAGPAEAMDIARVIHKWQELARTEENEAGAWIGKLPGYIMRQSHDPEKLYRKGFESWKDEMLKRLDWDRTAEGRLDPASDLPACEEYLRNVYDNLVTGIHGKAGAFADPLSSPRVVGSTAARASKERVLHFKSGEDFHAYNEKFGRGTLADGIFAGLERSAGEIAIMQKFGPSPEAGLNNLINDLKNTYKARMDVKSLRKLQNFLPRLHNQMKELDGTLNMEGSPTIAQVGRTVRAVESMAKLGGAVISGFSDIPLMAQEMVYQGKGFFQAMREGLASFARGRGSLEERQILSRCGVFFDSMLGDLTARFSGNDGAGKATALMNMFFKYNGLSWWSDTWKKSATLMMAHDLAEQRGLAWSALPRGRQRALSLYNIDEPIWDMLRKGRMAAADGREYFTPDAAADISRQELKAYMTRKGMRYSDERADLFRKEIANRLRSYFKDRVQYAVLEPDARTASIIHQGQSAGTVTGEALRFAMQFKSFPVVFLQRTFGREIYGRGADTWTKGLRQALPGNGEMSGMLSMIAATTLFGYLSMATKQIIAGKYPRNPTESPEDFGKVFVASLVQGGGLGLYGDFLFGEKSRVGDDFLSSLAGPTAGSVSSLVSLYKSIRDGEDVKSTAFRALWSHLPGNNLFWLRPVMDHLLLYSVYESLNRGYLKRLRKKIEKENNQTYMFEPHVWDWARR